MGFQKGTLVSALRLRTLMALIQISVMERSLTNAPKRHIEHHDKHADGNKNASEREIWEGFDVGRQGRVARQESGQHLFVRLFKELGT
jgi:hypothetical protein